MYFALILVLTIVTYRGLRSRKLTLYRLYAWILRSVAIIWCSYVSWKKENCNLTSPIVI